MEHYRGGSAALDLRLVALGRDDRRCDAGFLRSNRLGTGAHDHHHAEELGQAVADGTMLKSGNLSGGTTIEFFTLGESESGERFEVQYPGDGSVTDRFLEYGFAAEAPVRTCPPLTTREPVTRMPVQAPAATRAQA